MTALTDRQRNEIVMVEHLEKVLVDGLTGRCHRDPVFADPRDQVLAGVIFPESIFAEESTSLSTSALPDVPEEDEPTARQRLTKQSGRKLVSMGLEFRACAPVHGTLKISVSARFALYIKLFPTLQEQLKYEAEAGWASPPPDTEEVHTSIEDLQGSTEQKSHRELAPKYRRVEVEIPSVDVELDSSAPDGACLEISESVQEALSGARERILQQYGSELFSAKDSKRGNGVLVPGPWEDDDDFQEAINRIRQDPSLPDWKASILVLAEPDTDEDPTVRHVVVSLVNKTPIDQSYPHPLEFFDAEVRVQVVTGRLLPMRFLGVAADYRLDPKAPGLGIGCVAELADQNVLVTKSIPRFFQLWYRTRDDRRVDMSMLASSPLSELEKILVGMREYLEEWDEFLDSHTFSDPSHEAQSEADREAFRREIESLELGVRALKKDPRLTLAFKLMNRVFVESGKRTGISSWRLFQIVQIARLLPSLAAREYDDPEFEDQLNNADILWFPTGGGKTEAYLGLIVCALFYDRLRGKSRGTTAWLRFPLRMLSKQQLDRLARVLAHAEIVRRSCPELSEAQRGDMFSMGYFVGSGNTPNYVSTQQMEVYQKSPERLREDAMVLQRCPFCGQPVEMRVNTKAWRLEHCCTNSDCFAVTELNGTLPIFVTDSEVYRYLPSVLCGTVDKLAILGRSGEFGHFFGQVQGYCPDHGYFSGGECLEKRMGSKSCERPARELQKAAAIHDPTPALIIQDELHLLKEELGTFNGHYEGFLTALARKVGTGKPPKILAATATIEQYEQHTRHVYLRPASRFPVPGFRAGESFYATVYPEVSRRLYLGLLSHLRSKEQTIERCLEIYHSELRRLYELGPSAAAEIGIVGVRSQQEWTEFLSLYDLSVIYVNQKATAGHVHYRIEHSLNNRLHPRNAFRLNAETLTGDDPMEKIGSVIERIEGEMGANHDRKLHALIATSLISHGVDLERINAMFLCGMPSRFAEYIQATSRSARSHAGLVVVSFNGQDVREQSQYRYFLQNHQYLDRLVDPVPVHRFAQNATRRTMPGLIIGLLGCYYARHPLIWKKYKSRLEKAGDLQKIIPTEETSTKLLTWDRLLQDLFEIYGVDDPAFPASMRQAARKEIAAEFDEIRGAIMRAPADVMLKDEELLNPLTSFRDIDAGVEFTPDMGTAVIQTHIG